MKNLPQLRQSYTLRVSANMKNLQQLRQSYTLRVSDNLKNLNNLIQQIYEESVELEDISVIFISL